MPGDSSVAARKDPSPLAMRIGVESTAAITSALCVGKFLLG